MQWLYYFEYQHTGAGALSQGELNGEGRLSQFVSGSAANGRCSMNSVRNWFYSVAWLWMIVIGGLLITPIGPVCIVCGAEATKSSNPVELVVGLVSIAIGAFGYLAMVALNPQPLPPRKGSQAQ